MVHYNICVAHLKDDPGSCGFLRAFSETATHTHSTLLRMLSCTGVFMTTRGPTDYCLLDYGIAVLK